MTCASVMDGTLGSCGIQLRVDCGRGYSPSVAVTVTLPAPLVFTEGYSHQEPFNDLKRMAACHPLRTPSPIKNGWVVDLAGTHKLINQRRGYNSLDSCYKDKSCELEALRGHQSKVLRIALAVNGGMFGL